MKNEIFNKDGKLSEYGFSCGYVESVNNDNLHKQLYKEHGIYHVRSTKHNSPELNTQFDGSHSHKFTIWMSYYKLTDAKNLYNKIK